jgi:hypothetical protein
MGVFFIRSVSYTTFDMFSLLKPPAGGCGPPVSADHNLRNTDLPTVTPNAFLHYILFPTIHVLLSTFLFSACIRLFVSVLSSFSPLVFICISPVSFPPPFFLTFPCDFDTGVSFMKNS